MIGCYHTRHSIAKGVPNNCCRTWAGGADYGRDIGGQVVKRYAVKRPRAPANSPWFGQNHLVTSRDQGITDPIEILDSTP